MKKQINMDIDAVKEDFYKGLSLREFIFGLLGGVCGVGTIILLVFFCGVQINVAVTLGIPIIAIFGLFGFYEKDGMTLLQLVRKKIQIKKTKPLTYQSARDMNEPEVNPTQPLLIKILEKMEEKKHDKEND